VAPIDKETFRHVMGHVAGGVTVPTTSNADEDFGATAGAALVCPNRRRSTQEATSMGVDGSA
jgi:hypothetical protein